MPSAPDSTRATDSPVGETPALRAGARTGNEVVFFDAEQRHRERARRASSRHRHWVAALVVLVLIALGVTAAITLDAWTPGAWPR